jgi:hypothetical protein
VELQAGVLVGNVSSDTVEGTPQGAGVSPLLANVFLHYVLDLWVHQWRKRHACGRVVIVRYADDFVMGFQYEADARKMRAALHERLAAFGLVLHEDKTRLLEFGRLSTEQRAARGDRRPETFAFLGFTHYCARSRDGRFVVKRRTDRKRLTRKLHTVRTEQRRRMHTPLPEQHRWLCSSLRGHYRYYGLPSNFPALDGFYREVCRGWFRALSSSSCGHSPHAGGSRLLIRTHLGKSRVRESRTLGSVGGEAEWPSYPTNPAEPVPYRSSEPSRDNKRHLVRGASDVRPGAWTRGSLINLSRDLTYSKNGDNARGTHIRNDVEASVPLYLQC